MKFKNIFIIDDDIVFHFIVKKLFSKCNIEVNTNYFFNGLEALEKLKNTNVLPDLILLDINMPILDGWQFIEEYKNIKTQLEKEIPIYLVSSSVDITDMNKAKSYHEEVKNYYCKPFTQEDFHKIFS